MNARGHYLEGDPELQASFFAEAQVHATLALAAGTIADDDPEATS